MIDQNRPPVIRLRQVCLRYGRAAALDCIDLDIPAGCMAGFIGPDGVGKSTLFGLIAGSRRVQSGHLEVLGGDIADSKHLQAVLPRIAYMPQGLGTHLYPTLSIYENLDFFGQLFALDRGERRRRIAELLEATELTAFADRPVENLSGGMKQKLGLCCALIHDPDLLVLDEPTTGVDPLSRRHFWELIERIRSHRPGMSVLVATAYMEEAARFDWLAAMYAGDVLASGAPQEVLQRTGSITLEEAFIRMLPPEVRMDHCPVIIPPHEINADGDAAIRAEGLTMRFGDFTAVDQVSFRIHRGEIFGFLGSNGCGKTTTMKMLTGLLPPSEGKAWLFGNPVDPNDINTRRRVGYMTQSFSLYGELTVRQNLFLHARLFGIPPSEIPARALEMATRFGLLEALNTLPESLPLGLRQRLSLAVAMIHKPEMLILDEPTSGVDPVARDSFWQTLIDLARKDNVTIFVSTHFMNEAERCDRISFMHAGKVLVSDRPQALIEKRGVDTLEEAFISYLEEAHEQSPGHPPEATTEAAKLESISSDHYETPPFYRRCCDPGRLMTYARRETLELLRDPMRLILAGLGSIILMLVMGFGISIDVENLAFAVLDHDRTSSSRDYTLNLAGSRYFSEDVALRDYEDLDARMRAGQISLALEIPPGFARDVARGTPVQIGAWIDGSMPRSAEMMRGYVLGMHQHWCSERIRNSNVALEYKDLIQSYLPLVKIETRYRYNPEVKSIIEMVPVVISMILIMIPSMLTSLSVVRERELGSIINFYTTPTTRLEFLLGKQLPYIAFGLMNFVVITAMSILVLQVPFSGSFTALAIGALLYVTAATSIGQLISSFSRSQTAAIFGTVIMTIIPAVTLSGMLEPVSSMSGAGRLIGEIYPTNHFLTICRGTFSKALTLGDLQASFIPLLISIPLLTSLSVVLLNKQER